MDPTRFLDDDDGRFEARLLRAARTDEPLRGAMTRAEVALGLGMSAGMVATATATAAKAASAHVGAAHAVAQVGAVSLAKWLGIGIVSGLVVTTGLRYGTDPMLRASIAQHVARASHNTPARTSGGLPQAAARVGAMDLPVNGRDEPACATFSVPAPFKPPRDVARPGLAEIAVPAPAPQAPQLSFPNVIVVPPNESVHVASLSDELSILEQARHALGARQPDMVLRELEAYGRMPSARVLAAEAEMLAIEALLQQGNVGAAKARAAGFLRLAPNGPHAARLREIVALPSR